MYGMYVYYSMGHMKKDARRCISFESSAGLVFREEEKAASHNSFIHCWLLVNQEKSSKISTFHSWLCDDDSEISQKSH